jgi:hypothetical protein
MVSQYPLVLSDMQNHTPPPKIKQEQKWTYKERRAMLDECFQGIKDITNIVEVYGGHKEWSPPGRDGDPFYMLDPLTVINKSSLTIAINAYRSVALSPRDTFLYRYIPDELRYIFRHRMVNDYLPIYYKDGEGKSGVKHTASRVNSVVI